MPTTKKRLNISLTNEVDTILTSIAKRDNVPQATKAAELLSFALEIEEDIAWGKIASERDTKNAKYVEHKKAWA